MSRKELLRLAAKIATETGEGTASRVGRAAAETVQAGKRVDFPSTSANATVFEAMVPTSRLPASTFDDFAHDPSKVSDMKDILTSMRAKGFDPKYPIELEHNYMGIEGYMLGEGNHRLAAARHLGIEEVPVRIRAHGGQRPDIIPDEPVNQASRRAQHARNETDFVNNMEKTKNIHGLYR